MSKKSIEWLVAAPYSVAGSYYEACNCDPICPCRSVGGRPGGASTHGVCFGALSWHVSSGHSGATVLDDLDVVMCLRYYDHSAASTPWEVVLFVDSRGDDEQRHALEQIFLGREGGTVLTNFAAAIGEVHAVRTAAIHLSHEESRESISVDGTVEVISRGPVESAETVACGIPGRDRPGQELWTDLLRLEDPAMRWEVRGVCGFRTDFAYSSD